MKYNFYFQIIWSEEMEQKLSDLFKTYFMKVKNIISFIQDRGVEYSRKEFSEFLPRVASFINTQKWGASSR